MGLDITVYKPVPIGDLNPSEIEDFYILEEFPELKIFERYAFEKENSYFDIEGNLKYLRLEMSDVVSNGASYGKDTEFHFANKKHPLFEVYEWLKNIHLNPLWKANSRDETLEDLYNSDLFKEFQEKHLKTLLDNGWVEDYHYFATGNNTHYYDLYNAANFCGKQVEFSLINPSTFVKKDICLMIEEVGYQRKGANKQFYEDGKWDSPCITDKKTLLEDWEKYFSCKTPNSKGGWGSGVEFDQEEDEMKNNFKSNIVDKFIEGETFVIYH